MNNEVLGIYFSGTGNTKHCVERFASCLSAKSQVVSIENPSIKELLGCYKSIVFGYPIYFSNMPKIVSDFVKEHRIHFKNKEVFVLATMGLFSGDGAGCAARLLKKCGAKIVGGLHLQMPDCIGDEKLLKRTKEKNKEIIEKADIKIDYSAQKLINKKPTKEGMSIFCRIAGLFGQRLWFYSKTQKYYSKPNIDTNKCISCGICVKLCPMNNLQITDDKISHSNKCTLCYRCFGNCPQKAITILGKTVHEQHSFERYK